jgi:hypothetical protein
LQFLEVDADWNDSLKVILTSELPVVTWYEEYADKRDKVACSQYLLTQFLNDLTSELLLA